uniref:Uncharacterized protein n=1 Tax=Romanomermis culicivorax TaxID=13658 RepID=A0A915JEK9_ROMCU
MQLLKVFPVFCAYILALNACAYLESQEFKSKPLNNTRCLLSPGPSKKAQAIQNTAGEQWCNIFVAKLFCTQRCSNSCRPRLWQLKSLKCPPIDCKDETKDISKIYLHCVCEGLNFQDKYTVE